MPSKTTKPFEAVCCSAYIGRRRLGRVSQTQKKRFEAFGSDDRRLGIFKSRAKALSAIRKASIKTTVPARNRFPPSAIGDAE
jgi:hypothetical protein